ncbi:MAG: helix-turn-helix transcriptional regulator [Bacteroidota bacterium]
MQQFRDIEAIKILSTNVRKYRTERNISMEALANMVGVEYSQISRLERGLLNTSVSLIFAIAKALDIKPSKLLDHE